MWGETIAPADCYKMFPAIATAVVLLGGKTCWNWTWTYLGTIGLMEYDWGDPYAPAPIYSGFFYWVLGTEPPGP